MARPTQHLRLVRCRNGGGHASCEFSVRHQRGAPVSPMMMYLNRYLRESRAGGLSAEGATHNTEQEMSKGHGENRSQGITVIFGGHLRSPERTHRTFCSASVPLSIIQLRRRESAWSSLEIAPEIHLNSSPLSYARVRRLHLLTSSQITVRAPCLSLRVSQILVGL